MKIFGKIKQLSRDIKLLIIGGLIVSCFSVYAAGTCIISATADDVTYKNTTVQAAIDELYSMTENYCPDGYECKKLNYATDCDNNKIYTTTPDNLSGLAKKMAESAFLDSGKSEYVSSCNGVNFNAISSNTNGKGIYEIASTKNDTYPIYYYRGAVDNNNVKFAGLCWKAIRTTDTGGVKMIYNGEPDQDGYCTNTTGTATEIGTSKFAADDFSPGYIGYMYGTLSEYYYKLTSNLNSTYVYGNDVTYSGNTYTLTNTITTTGTWSSDYNTLNNNHYTCLSMGTTCSTVYYAYYTHSTSGVFFTKLTNGEKIEDVLDEMFNGSNVNTNNSNAKTQVDNWYNSNLSSYNSYIEDTVYCNDRSISDLAGWNPNGGDTTKSLYFSPRNRVFSTYTPTLSCSRAQDRFTVSSSKGNGALTYPIGLITGDEIMYAGGKNNIENNTYYLYTNSTFSSMSPLSFMGIDTYFLTVNSNGSIYSNNISNSYGIRPVISISPYAIISGGDGTSTNPYVVQTS